MKKLIVAGDSWTYGSEIRDPDLPESIKDWDAPNDAYRLPRIWPTKLGKMLGIEEEVINLSYPASSNDGIMRRTIAWITQEYIAKNKDTSELFVVIGLTSPERRDFFYRDRDKIDDPKHDRWWFTLWPMWTHKYPQPTISKFAELYSTYMWNPEEYIHRYLNQIYYLQLFFEKYNIKYLFFQSFYQYKDMCIKDWRDGPYNRHYNGQPDQILWELIDSTRFMHKNEDMHSFHNYIKTKDTSPNNKDAFIIMHPSELAHTWWAEHVYEYCTKNNLC